jgi:hypothetical protein
MLWRGAAEGLMQGVSGRRRIPNTIEPVDRAFAPFKRDHSPRIPAMPSGLFETTERVRPLAAEPLRLALLEGAQNGGGAPSELRAVARELARLGHEVHLVAPGERPAVTFDDGYYRHEIRPTPRSQYRAVAMRGRPEIAARLDGSHAAFDELSALVANDGVQLVDVAAGTLAGLVTAVSGLLPVVCRRPAANDGRAPSTPPVEGSSRLERELATALEQRSAVVVDRPLSAQQLVELYHTVLEGEGTRVEP